MSGSEVNRVWQVIRRIWVAAAVGGLVLGSVLASAPAGVADSARHVAADQPLGPPLIVDAAKTSVTTGTVELKAGVRYELQVSGTFTITGSGGQGFSYDALYCFGDHGFDPSAGPQCAPPRRNVNFYVGVGASPLQAIDSYQSPGGSPGSLPYSGAHSYTTVFYAPADGKLTAGGSDAYDRCKSAPNPCQDTISGSLTVQVLGPAGGGGGGLALPTAFCAGSAHDLTGPSAQTASGKCALKRFVTKAEKAQALQDVHDFVRATAFVCAHISDPELGLAVFLTSCSELIDMTVEALRIAQAPTEPLNSARDAWPAAGSGCPKGLTASRCAVLRAALSNYPTVLRATASAGAAIADGADKITEAVHINHPASAFFQAAYAKVNEGALAIDLAATQISGQALTRLLQTDHLDLRLSSRQAKRELSNLPANVLPKSKRKLFLSQLSSISGPVSASALSAPLASSAFAAHYRSISLSDLAAIVYGLWRNGHYSNGVEQTLTADLTTAQNACGNPSRRIAAMQQFVADAAAKAGSYGGFLRLGAQPLMGSSVPASACR